VAVRRPLARLPENVVKFAVGVMLTSFGMFWGAEGAGAHWPGSDAAIPVLVVLTALASIGAAALLRRQRLVAAPRPPARSPACARSPPSATTASSATTRGWPPVWCSPSPPPPC